MWATAQLRMFCTNNELRDSVNSKLFALIVIGELSMPARKQNKTVRYDNQIVCKIMHSSRLSVVFRTPAKCVTWLTIIVGNSKFLLSSSIDVYIILYWMCPRLMECERKRHHKTCVNRSTKHLFKWRWLWQFRTEFL